MASIAVVLLRFLRERYEASSLYAGRGLPDIPGSARVPLAGRGEGEEAAAKRPDPPDEP
jgi:hypothetical protein